MTYCQNESEKWFVLVFSRFYTFTFVNTKDYVNKQKQNLI